MKIHRQHEPSGWLCYIIGGPDIYGSTALGAPKGGVPCVFHRFMQRIILGFIWVKDAQASK